MISKRDARQPVKTTLLFCLLDRHNLVTLLQYQIIRDNLRQADSVALILNLPVGEVIRAVVVPTDVLNGPRRLIVIFVVKYLIELHLDAAGVVFGLY